MELCWGHLTPSPHRIVKHLELECPKLKALRVKTKRLSCSVTFDLVLRMAKVRAGAGKRLYKIKRVVPADEGNVAKTGEPWDTLARTVDRYLRKMEGEDTEYHSPIAECVSRNRPGR